VITVKFTEFHEHGPSEQWHAVVVRPIADLDVPTVASIYAEREGADLKLALERVSRWADPNQRRFVLVAAQRGRIQGYGKAEMLSPSEGGGNAPTGWYLTGLVVAPLARRHGVGARLTEERIRALAARTNDIWYVANLRNRATIALHERHGFVFQTRDFSIPGVAFEGGQGALFRLCIRPS
jgi:ribosomal protein S18 acetylase RimI-like enzyme